MSRNIISVHIAVLLCLMSVPLTAQNTKDSQYTDIVPFITQNKIILSWDTMYNAGLLTKGATVISFKPNFSYILVNFKTQYTIPLVIMKDETLFVHKDFIDMVQKIFKARKKTDTIPVRSANAKNTYKRPRRSNFSNISVVVIDPGHGNKDSGAIGRNTYKRTSYKIMEKDVALAVSLRVKNMLRQYFPKLTIVLTRDSDTYISLEERTVVANKYLDALKEREAILFISIHANAALRPQAKGYEVWYLPTKYRRDNLVNESINLVNESIDNAQLYSIINSLREEEITLESVQLATRILDGMDLTIGTDSKNRGIKEEQWYVVRNAKMPAVLIELGFVTNPEEGYNLLRTEYQKKLSEGIVAGIKSYIELFDIPKIP